MLCQVADKMQWFLCEKGDLEHQDKATIDGWHLKPIVSVKWSGQAKV